jgi:hypothetical protein
VKLTKAVGFPIVTLALAGGLAVAAPNALAQDVTVDGGTSASSTTLVIGVDGGTGIGDASGGDTNTAQVNANGDDVADIASAGNGGVATASANGGAVSVGNVNSGGNSGNSVAVGNINSGGGGGTSKPSTPSKPGTTTTSKGGNVKGLPSTGAGLIGDASGLSGLLALGSFGALGAAAYNLRRRFF